jgi:hypothetical protein
MLPFYFFYNFAPGGHMNTGLVIYCSYSDLHNHMSFFLLHCNTHGNQPMFRLFEYILVHTCSCTIVLL